jgi:hypothetical protein
MEAEVGQVALLPDGDTRVRIEEIHSDGWATVRRIDGDLAGTIAICKVLKLEPAEEVAAKTES